MARGICEIVRMSLTPSSTPETLGNIISIKSDSDKVMSLKIHKDTIIRNKFFDGYARTLPITWFVIHGTGGGGTLRWMRYQVKLNSKRGLKYQRGVGLFHYLIERNGMIWEIIDPDMWVWHASVGNIDGGTIGVELLNPSPFNRKKYTVEQYDALLALYTHLRTKKYPKMDIMISHNRAKQKISGRTKKCPGKGFDWRLWRNMVAKQYKYAHNHGESLWDIKMR